MKLQQELLLTLLGLTITEAEADMSSRYELENEP